ncbi:hypothetical protein A3D72_03700 [Candidatus Uhrbacteria bacterium RIFCSPHIGHO2_02_FULL_57_19]|uniref:Cell envelope-related transcriptional attenuator domain-containing protein n=1 Tax=Candidatus Uhrbacteria bacterium RIFCSPHIGHO2_02_FULL_57_19 TaxID=1802391 RepID=A0A1F7U7M0_9BACT|nr:MAG: hypothetical protein A3D72_03700 [Candidatus Uhrbacteria bacterium RIFCSPHIGHO2_02_FULL_57_19]
MDDLPKVNLLDPREVPPEVRTRRRKRRWAALSVISGLALWQGISGGLGSVAPNETVDAFSPLALISRVGQIMVKAEKSLVGEGDDRVNILLLGMGGAGHNGPYLTDTIILSSIKPSTNRAALLSIPRDLLVDIPGYGWRKINNANAFAEADKPGSGGDAARRAVEGAFGVPVPYFVRVDFAGFRKLIDDLGGVSINVERSFSDSYFPTNDDLTQTVRFDAGLQTMDGQRALIYARSRHGSNGEGSDFARARRQQKVLLALRDKMLSAGTLTNPRKIKSIIDALSKHVATNIDFREIIRLVDLARELDSDKIVHRVLDDAPGGPLVAANYDGAFVLQPSDGTGEILKSIARSILDTRAIAGQEETPRLEIQNGTSIEGLAYRTSLTLRERGYQVVAYGNAARRDYQRSVVYDLTSGAKKKELKILADLLDAEAAATIPDWLSVSNSVRPDFLIILGKSQDSSSE